MKILWILGLILLISQVSASTQAEPVYTEDIQTFKKDNANARMQLLIGCWYLARSFTSTPDKFYRVYIIKLCMQKIGLKESLNVISSLIGKNQTQPKQFLDIVRAADIDLRQIKTTYSEFDEMILGYIKGYQQEIEAVLHGKPGEELRTKIEQERVKRQKYYLGFIPANRYTHIMMLVVIAILMVLVCTCWKYTMKKKEFLLKQQLKKEGFFNQNHDCKDHEHSFTKEQKPKQS